MGTIQSLFSLTLWGEFCTCILCRKYNNFSLCIKAARYIFLMVYTSNSPSWMYKRACWVAIKHRPKQRRAFANTIVPCMCAIWYVKWELIQGNIPFPPNLGWFTISYSTLSLLAIKWELGHIAILGQVTTKVVRNTSHMWTSSAFRACIIPLFPVFSWRAS